MPQDLLSVIFILLGLSTLLVALCVRFHLPPILGYLATGLLAGPHALNWLPDSPATHFLAETGVVLLMFTIGLEFSLPKVLAARRLVLGLGWLQVIVTAALVGLGGWLLGLAPAAAFVVGAALAMSSTAIVLKQLAEQLELGQPHGRAATAVLLAQDLAAVPLLALIPALGSPGESGWLTLAEPLLRAVLLFAVMMTLGERLLEAPLHRVAATRSPELLLLAALLVVIAMAASAHAAGLSPALGAFLAGMVLGESEFRHQVEADIRPFRDLLLGLFFATVGMALDPGVVLREPLAVAAVLLVLFLLKGVLVALLTRLFGFDAQAAVRTGLVLAQAGEFGLLLLSLGLDLQLVPAETTQILFAAMVLSMVLAPLVLRYNGTLAQRLVPGSLPDPGSAAAVDAGARAHGDHVIICGYGRLGQNLAALLTDAGFDTLALDLDIERVRRAADAGEAVLFGDATDPAVLEAAGLDRARAVAVTFDDPEAALALAQRLRLLHPDRLLLVRCRDARYEARLRATGAEVYPEGLETSLSLAAQLMILLGLPAEAVEARMNEVRAEDYALLRTFFHATEAAESRQDDYAEQRWRLVVEAGDHAEGRTPAELGLDRPPPRLERILRGGLQVPGEQNHIRLRPGDILVLRGTPEQYARAESRLRQGLSRTDA